MRPRTPARRRVLFVAVGLPDLATPARFGQAQTWLPPQPQARDRSVKPTSPPPGPCYPAAAPLTCVKHRPTPLTCANRLRAGCEGAGELCPLVWPDGGDGGKGGRGPRSQRLGFPSGRHTGATQEEGRGDTCHSITFGIRASDPSVFSSSQIFPRLESISPVTHQKYSLLLFGCGSELLWYLLIL